MARLPGYFPGMGPIRGFNSPEPEAPPEVVHGGPVNPDHGQWGEQAQPYSWQSQLTNFSGHMGPYGPQNQLLDDENWSGLNEGYLAQGPYSDMTPGSAGKVGSGHAAPRTVTLSGPLPSQYDAINGQLVPAAEIRSTDLGGSREYSLTQLGDAVQDSWAEIWDISNEPTKYPPGQPWNGFAVFGFGTNDRPVNPLRKANGYGFNMGHHHRRFATGSIPGNYMWMRPGGRPMVKSLPGPARPAIGPDSPFEGDDLGLSFGIQGAVLTEVPSEYQPPPSPTLAAPVNYDEPSPGIALW